LQGNEIQDQAVNGGTINNLDVSRLTVPVKDAVQVKASHNKLALFSTFSQRLAALMDFLCRGLAQMHWNPK
jgi:hypothetical protein